MVQFPEATMSRLFRPQKSERPTNRRGVLKSPHTPSVPRGRHDLHEPQSAEVDPQANVEHTVEQDVPLDGSSMRPITLVLLRLRADAMPVTGAELLLLGTIYPKHR